MKSGDDKSWWETNPKVNGFYMRMFFVVWETMGKEELSVVIKINELNLVTRERLNLEMDRLVPLEDVKTPLKLSVQDTLLYYTVTYFDREIYKTDIAREHFENIKKKVGHVKYSFTFYRESMLSIYTKLLNHLASRLKDYPPFEERKKLLDNNFVVN